jgi:predicted DNA-binding transcriptional regulator AlpA
MATAQATGSQLPLIDVREVSRRLGCSPRTTFRLADLGKLPPSMRVGNLRKWNSYEIDQYIDNRCKWPVEASTGRRS